ncbi:MAG: hypothetical protein ACYS1A_08255 [Planctomycetota bacterium]|jgi:hypothetical protein
MKDEKTKHWIATSVCCDEMEWLLQLPLIEVQDRNGHYTILLEGKKMNYCFNCGSEIIIRDGCELPDGGFAIAE